MSDEPNAAAPETAADGAPGAPPPRRRSGRLPLLLALVVVLGGALWSGYWWIATRAIERGIEAELARLAETGVTVTCDDRRLGGYPFRFDLRCGPLSARGADGSQATVSTLTIAALAYRPSRMIVETGAPLSARFADGSSAVLGWSLAHASLDFDRAGLSGLAVSVEKPDLRAGDAAPVTAGLAELHTRLHPDGKGSDVAVTAEDVALPALGETGTLRVVAELQDGGLAARADTAAFVRRLAEEGTAGKLTEVRLSAGGAELRISGPFAVDAGGEISGSFKVSLVNPQTLTDLLARGFGITLPLPDPGSLAGLLSGLGSPSVDGRPAMTLPIEVRRGKMTMGFVPLGRLPRLFDPAWFRTE